MPLLTKHRQQATHRKERRELAESATLATDEVGVERLREVAETQLALQADYASSLDTQALTLLTVDVALAGIAITVLVSSVSLPHHWVFALGPLAVSVALAFAAVTAYGPLTAGADIVEILEHQKNAASTLATAELSVLLARRAIEARELNLVRLRRKQSATSRGVLALLVAAVVLAVLALADPGVQSKHVPRPHPIHRKHHRPRGRRGQYRQLSQ